MFLQNLVACPACEMLQRIPALSPGESGTSDSLTAG